MYYPYLRARQFELIALRELAAEEKTQNVILPVLEPVKSSNNNLNLLHKVLQEHDQAAYLIVNPLVGEVTGDSVHYLEYLNSLDGLMFRPAFHFRNNAEYIRQSVSANKLSACMLICQGDVSADDPEFSTLMELTEIAAVNVEDPGKNRSLDRFLRRLEKDYIRLDDLFEKQTRNVVFLNIPAHRFSEEHLYFDEEGFKGFSDYTVLPNEYSDGGSTPRAVVIHFTYLNSDKQIWIRHFTSDTNDSIANVQGKFAEAARKAVDYCRHHELTNSAIKELETFFDEEHYPGLGIIKKISIKNHLLVVGEYLRNR